MVHSTTTEAPESIQHCFIAGVVAAEMGVAKVTVMNTIEKFKSYYPLATMAMYDGYIRRKYGLVDENGEEIFR